MAKYLCTERCFDSQKCRSFYEEEVYDLSASEMEHLEKIGQAKRFRPLEARAVTKPTTEKKERNPENTGSEKGSETKPPAAGPGESPPKAATAGRGSSKAKAGAKSSK
jgi:hypothetical protein